MGALAALLLVASIAAGGAHAAGSDFPQYDIASACRTQADYAFAATLGQTDTDKEITACSAHEQEDMNLARALWLRASRKDAADCLALAEGRYGRLMRCLDTSPSLRTVR